jgi:hypothetical protein
MTLLDALRNNCLPVLSAIVKVPKFEIVAVEVSVATIYDWADPPPLPPPDDPKRATDSAFVKKELLSVATLNADGTSPGRPVKRI